ncbi:DUF5131 family protein [Oceanicaulis sp.]|uniref:DUF5131 family protein n=1 Tax=Oceanicaulis sp. TaxID=1924941 RepID=UPI003F70FAA1
MAEDSGIEWTTHTFNPWIGCTKVSAACDFCYAEKWDHRFGGNRWGPHADRTLTKTWPNPRKWNRQADKTGIRPRVFVASLADVFDNHRSILPGWREDLWKLIDETPNLDWLLLTKRPQNIMKMIPERWRDGLPSHVWIGTTVEDQKSADQRIPALLQVPAAIRFLSCEPLIGPVDLTGHFWGPVYLTNHFCGPAKPCAGCSRSKLENGPALHWVIAGGESGAQYRPADPDWFRQLRDQCAEADVPFLFKQWEGPDQKAIKAKGRALDGVIHDGYPVQGGMQ